MKGDEAPGETPQKPEATPNADQSSQPMSKEALEAEMTRLKAEIAQLDAESLALQARLIAEEFEAPAVDIHDLSTKEVVFAGVARIAEDGSPQMIATWKGRVPLDFDDYIDRSKGTGPWLIGRMGVGICPSLEPTRFCFQVTPEGVLVAPEAKKLIPEPENALEAAKPEASVKLEELKAHISKSHDPLPK